MANKVEYINRKFRLICSRCRSQVASHGYSVTTTREENAMSPCDESVKLIDNRNLHISQPSVVHLPPPRGYLPPRTPCPTNYTVVGMCFPCTSPSRNLTLNSKHILQLTNWTELQFTNSRRNGIQVLRTNRALTVLVSLQPINTKLSRDAEALDQSAPRVTGSTCSVQFICCEQAVTLIVTCEPTTQPSPNPNTPYPSPNLGTGWLVSRLVSGCWTQAQ